MKLLIYLILGIIVGFIHWFLILNKESKEHLSILIALPLSIILWPAIVIGWSYKFVEYSNDHMNG
jgi:hypothetical protein